MKIHPSRGSNSQHTGCQPANVAAWASNLRQQPKLHNIGIVRSTPISKKTLTIISQKASIFQPNSTQLVHGVLEDFASVSDKLTLDRASTHLVVLKSTHVVPVARFSKPYCTSNR